MSRTALFDAIRPLAPDRKIPTALIPSINAMTDALGLPRIPATTMGPDPELIAALKIDEGLRLKAYLDTEGVWTVGYGHAHVAPGTVWTQAQAEAALIADAAKHNAELAKALPWILKLDHAKVIGRSPDNL